MLGANVLLLVCVKYFGFWLASSYGNNIHRNTVPSLNSALLLLWVSIQGVSPPPGAVLVLHSLPLEFPLAVAFAEQLLTWKQEDGEGRSDEEPDAIPASVFLQVVEILGESEAVCGAFHSQKSGKMWFGGLLRPLKNGSNRTIPLL